VDEVNKMSKKNAEAGYPEDAGALPSTYGETMVLVVPVDPTVAHVYWDVSPADLERSGSAQAVLRFYDIDGEDFDGTNARGFFDLAVDLAARSSYASLGGTARSCQVDLGFVAKDGRFVTLARSNTVQLPRSGPSPRKEDRYIVVRGDEEEEAAQGERASTDKAEQTFRREPEVGVPVSVDRPTIAARAESQEETNEDLTELSERSFESGLSSA
jgi:hypothetical protein